MITNADITLYNRVFDKDKDKYTYKRTYLRGVNWQDLKGVKITESGVVSDDCTRVFIPLAVDADGKQYKKPKTYKRTEDKSLIYTLDNADIVVKGVIDFELTGDSGANVSKLQALYDDVMVITKVIDNRYGTPKIQHFELEVK